MNETPKTNDLVAIEGVSKAYGPLKALDNVSLRLAGGQIIGLLGPNGSGKTTLIKILTGLLTDYQGSVRVLGAPVGPQSKAAISYLPDRNYFPDWMRARDAIALFRDFYADFSDAKAFEMLTRLGLSADQKIKSMSKGMIEKFQLCLVMSRAAKLYVLDEPLAGVDPAARDFILDTVLTNYSESSSILISTHLIADVERIFDSAIFLKNGQIVLHDNIDAIRAEHGKSLDQLFREVFKC
ncbi:ABC transporter ATP-binding protein [Feifania hominis]|uniref:ABC transporter ATP-binding protein n=1 Tax=Feifania hominis TaxID=2763660 RepID=A0A926DHK1_9FIRM|nr:ABC transporter ATP-binding protein [Feifania hominis]MBC8537195.1 ABC transporter ATP-binding protein [Feifania hominis]